MNPIRLKLILWKQYSGQDFVKKSIVFFIKFNGNIDQGTEFDHK